ncbi:MAG: solute carrier family 23 protein, partial [Cyclobacteriaceae bacterium]
SGVLLSILIMTILSNILQLNVERVQLGNAATTITEFWSTITGYFPVEVLKPQYVFMALPFALELALLAYLDSLLTALVVDRITKEKSNLNRELIAQGLANGVAGVLQGIPGAQATIRSVLLIKEGAQTRLAGIMIGVFVLLSIIAFKEYLTLVPSAVFMGVLLKAGLDVSDKDFLKNYISLRWFTSMQRNIQLGLIAFTTLVTVIVDLNVAVIAGTIVFYVAKYFWKITDVEADMQEVVLQETKSKLITG